MNTLTACGLEDTTRGAGHLARLPPQRLAKQALLAYNLAWWRKQQNNPHGHRHEKRRGNLSRWENPLGRHHPKHHSWMEVAQFRDRWKLYYPSFEKRVFGPNCPHDFTNIVEHNPDAPPRRAEHSEHPPPPKRAPRAHTPTRKGRARSPKPPLSEDGRHPKKRRTSHPKVPTENAPKKPTQAEIAQKWKRDLDLPLSSLALFQDERRASLGVRRGDGA